MANDYKKFRWSFILKKLSLLKKLYFLQTISFMGGTSKIHEYYNYNPLQLDHSFSLFYTVRLHFALIVLISFKFVKVYEFFGL